MLNDVVAGCLVTGRGDGSTVKVAGRPLGGCGGGLGGDALNGASTYSFVFRSASGLGAANETGGGGRNGAKGAVRGGGALMMGARGLCTRGKDVGPPW